AKDDLPLALLLAFLFGVLSSLTPCVYPIIPVTVAYIGSRSEGQRKTHGFVLSLAYVLGLALVYAILGAVSARVGAAFGSLTQNLWVVLFIAALFFVLSLSMFNLFEIRLPSAFTSRVEQTKQKGHGKGLGGAFLIGALSGLVVSPCIGPLILAILVVVASTHSVLLGFTYLFVFALGLGVLFLVIGTFSGVLASLPKSGGWMDGIRVIFGALILMAAFYFAGLYLPRTVYWIAAGLALSFVILFLLFGARKHFFSKPIRVLGILLCVLAFIGALPFLPPAGGTSGGASPEGWQTSLPKAVSLARREGKPLLLDFRADWCAACLDLEKETWTDPGAQKDLDKVVPVRMDMTVNSAANRALLNRFGVKGLPTVILLEPLPPRSR
ncbi:MAG: cytochrome c biogenesis protein CcdA, partial [Acidobacteriota bacterium]